MGARDGWRRSSKGRRRPVRDVEQTIGRDRLRQEVKRRGYHMIECGGQFLIICSKGRMVVHA